MPDTVLHTAIRDGKFAHEIRDLLKNDQKIEIDALGDDDKTALRIAIEMEKYDTAIELLERGASFNLGFPSDMPDVNKKINALLEEIKQFQSDKQINNFFKYIDFFIARATATQDVVMALHLIDILALESVSEQAWNEDNNDNEHTTFYMQQIIKLLKVQAFHDAYMAGTEVKDPCNKYRFQIGDEKLNNKPYEYDEEKVYQHAGKLNIARHYFRLAVSIDKSGNSDAVDSQVIAYLKKGIDYLIQIPVEERSNTVKVLLEVNCFKLAQIYVPQEWHEYDACEEGLALTEAENKLAHEDNDEKDNDEDDNDEDDNEEKNSAPEILQSTIQHSSSSQPIEEKEKQTHGSQQENLDLVIKFMQLCVQQDAPFYQEIHSDIQYYGLLEQPVYHFYLSELFAKQDLPTAIQHYKNGLAKLESNKRLMDSKKIEVSKSIQMVDIIHLQEGMLNFELADRAKRLWGMVKRVDPPAAEQTLVYIKKHYDEGIATFKSAIVNFKYLMAVQEPDSEIMQEWTKNPDFCIRQRRLVLANCQRGIAEFYREGDYVTSCKYSVGVIETLTDSFSIQMNKTSLNVHNENKEDERVLRQTREIYALMRVMYHALFGSLSPMLQKLAAFGWSVLSLGAKVVQEQLPSVPAPGVLSRNPNRLVDNSGTSIDVSFVPGYDIDFEINLSFLNTLHEEVLFGLPNTSISPILKNDKEKMCIQVLTCLIKFLLWQYNSPLLPETSLKTSLQDADTRDGLKRKLDELRIADTILRRKTEYEAASVICQHNKKIALYNFRHLEDQKPLMPEIPTVLAPYLKKIAELQAENQQLKLQLASRAVSSSASASSTVSSTSTIQEDTKSDEPGISTTSTSFASLSLSSAINPQFERNKRKHEGDNPDDQRYGQRPQSP